MAKPENVLKSAEGLSFLFPLMCLDLLKTGQHMMALEALEGVFKNKRNKTYAPVLDQVMTMALKICVEGQHSRRAREILVQFRNICMNTNPDALVKVVKEFIRSAEENTRDAQQKADKVLLEVSDLEGDESAEALLLAAALQTGSAERSEREAVIRSLRFLWESYRHSIELLKNNSKVDDAYKVPFVAADV
jgi:translation initiation factor 3 subunit A